MIHSLSRIGSLAPLAAIFLISVILASCASRPAPMQRSLIVTVNSVSVGADLASDWPFADDLHRALSQSVGRSSRDIGESAALRVYVRQYRKAISGHEAVVDIELTSTETGRLIYTGSARKFGSTRQGLVETIVYDVRRLVGVSGALPVPVGGNKAPVVRPASKPAVEDLPADIEAETIKVADPLLNGTFTPDTDISDAQEILAAPPVIDTSKPLLAEEPAAKPAAGTVVPKPEPAPKVEKAQPTAPDAAASDEPCVVTVDNDCSDPDD